MNMTLKIVLSAIAILVVTFVIGTVVFVKGGFYQKMEQDYQQQADQARVADMHYLAQLIENYKAETGYYPLQKDAIKRRAAIYLQIDKVSAKDFAAQLSQGLNKKVCVPHDPQRIQTNVPTWYIYEVGPDDYFVTAHLQNKRVGTRSMNEEHGDPAPEPLRNGYYYQIGSKEIPELMVTKFSTNMESVTRPDTLPNGCPGL